MLCCRLNEPSDCEELRSQREAPALPNQCLTLFLEDVGLLTEREKLSRQGDYGSKSLEVGAFQAGVRTREPPRGNVYKA